MILILFKGMRQSVIFYDLRNEKICTEKDKYQASILETEKPQLPAQRVLAERSTRG